MSEDGPKTSTHTSRPLAALVWEEDNDKKQQTVTSSGLTIGRSSDNKLVIKDLESSRFHCKLMLEEEDIIVVDLGSSNGTFVNGQRVVEKRILHHGDLMTIGKLKFDFQLDVPDVLTEPFLDEDEATPFQATEVVPPADEYPRLVVSSGTGKGTEFPLTKERMLIGRASRDQQWDIDLVDRAVSRPHAELLRHDDEWVLTDLGSANGTSLNAEPVSASNPLQDGDALGFGETVLIFRAGQGA